MKTSLSEVVLRFPAPGFDLRDARLAVHLDGAMVFDGGFGTGFEHRVTACPGKHRIDVRLSMNSGVPRSRTWYFEVGVDERCSVGLEYSRMAACFNGTLAIRRTPLG